MITRRLEAELPKARILELYLNVIEWGDGIYGVEAASEHYFGQSASALAPPSSALLAGAIINPRLLNPAHPTPRLLRRQQMILKRMGAVTPPVEVARSKPADPPEMPAVLAAEPAPDTVSEELPTPPPATEQAPAEPK